MKIGDMRDLIKKGVILKIFLHIDLGIFEVFIKEG